jgi:hypothetical protein
MVMPRKDGSILVCGDGSICPAFSGARKLKEFALPSPFAEAGSW